MRASAVSGIIFANSHDKNLSHLTKYRSMASVPFGGRYRLVDFALSSFVNSGITNVGIITKTSYRSLMDHIGSGKAWDLDRKSGGIRILPPFNVKGLRQYEGYIEALYGAMEFMEKCNSEHIVLFEGNLLGNFDLSSALEFHEETNADVTFLYKTLSDYQNKTCSMTMELDKNGRVKSADFPKEVKTPTPTAFGVMIFKRTVLMELIEKGYKDCLKNIEKDIIANKLNELKVYGFEHKGFAAIMDSEESFVEANMALLNKNIRNELFKSDLPIYTKSRDDMPTRYGVNAKVENCYIADGCVIEGTVKNSIVFRGTVIEKGARVENSILMQGVSVGENTELECIVSDKNTVFGKDLSIKGTAAKHIFTEKNKTF